MLDHDVESMSKSETKYWVLHICLNVKVYLPLLQSHTCLKTKHVAHYVDV